MSAHCWHGNDTDDDGDVRANIDLVGVEHEGGGPGNESEPLTVAQLEATIKLTAWMAAQFELTRFERFGYHGRADAWLLVEHNEVGNTPTACPSGRASSRCARRKSPPTSSCRRTAAPSRPTTCMRAGATSSTGTPSWIRCNSAWSSS